MTLRALVTPIFTKAAHFSSNKSLSCGTRSFKRSLFGLFRANQGEISAKPINIQTKWNDTVPRAFLLEKLDSTTNGFVPLLLDQFDGYGFQSASSGVAHGCVVIENQLYSWGSNYYGQVGQTLEQPFVLLEDEDIDYVDKAHHVSTLENENLLEVASGSFHNIVRSASGKAWAWGAGVLGLGDEIYDRIPKQIQFFDSIERFVERVYASSAYTIAIASPLSGGSKNQEVYLWGYYPTQSKNIRKSLLPSLVEHLYAVGRIEDIACGPRHFSAIVNKNENQSILTFGSEDLEPLEVNIEKPYYPQYHETEVTGEVYSEQPLSRFSVAAALGNNAIIRQISAGIGYNVLLLGDNSAYITDIVGSNIFRLPLSEDIISVSAGTSHVAAISTSGNVYLLNISDLASLTISKEPELVLQKPGLSRIVCQWDRFLVY
ncbi:uncharacterized protein VTP21DRAFT_1369 [Calcarisporiella thermophila]|uniref:uncharacterized protein n=1 Tax=Calcarisporiella thermophila TaxID=911321 RepID=UPI003742D330